MANRLVDFSEASGSGERDWRQDDPSFWDALVWSDWSERERQRLGLRMAMEERARRQRLAEGTGSALDIGMNVLSLPVKMIEAIPEIPGSLKRSAEYAAAVPLDRGMLPDETEAEWRARVAGMPSEEDRAIEAAMNLSMFGGKGAPVTTNRLVVAGKRFGKEPIIPEFARVAADKPFAKLPAAVLGTKAMTAGEMDDILRGLGYDPGSLTFAQKLNVIQKERGRAEAVGGGEGEAAAGGPIRGGVGREAGGGAVEAGIRQAQDEASAAASGEAPLEGLPVTPRVLEGGKHYVPGPSATARKAARDYMADAGLPYEPHTKYHKVDRAKATRIAQAFEDMPHDPYDPKVLGSYNALINETMAQWEAIKRTGLQVEFNPPGTDPYKSNPRLAMKDIRDNNHLYVFPTEEGFGSGAEAAAATRDNPMLRPVNETISGKPVVANDIFRIVHDYFGHYKEGVGFRAAGEENAFQSHVKMYSDEAKPAMASETRGQNSWVNYGPHGEKNKTASSADTQYAPQKIGIMPEWTLHAGGRKEAAALILAGQGRKGLFAKSAAVVADKLPETFTAERAAATLENAGLKGDELSPIKAWLDHEKDVRSRPGSNQPKEISKQELIDAIHESLPNLKEWQRGGGKGDHIGLDEDGAYRIMDEDGFPIDGETYISRDRAEQAMWESGIEAGKPAKYTKYTLPGGRNKREIGLQYDRGTPSGWRVLDSAGYPEGDLYTPLHATREAAEEAARRIGGSVDEVPGEGQHYRGKHWNDPDEVDTFAHARIDERQVVVPGYVVENAISGNKSPVFHSFEEAERYRNKLPHKSDTGIVQTRQPVDAMHVDELQNDPAQDARKYGWATPEKLAEIEADTARARKNLDKRSDELNAALDEGIELVTTGPKATAATAGRVHRANVPFALRNIGRMKEIGITDLPQAFIDRAAALVDRIEEAKSAVAEAGRDLDASLGAGEKLIPDLPFKKTEQWSGLMWKRLIQEAVARGKEWVTWTTGAVQNDRYRLSNQVNRMNYEPVVEGGETKYVLNARTTDGNHWVSVNNGQAISAKELPGFVGDELAGRIIKGEGEETVRGLTDDPAGRRIKVLTDLDVNVGGKGMEKYYDEITPSVVGSITKRHGVKIEKGEPVGVKPTVDKKAQEAALKRVNERNDEVTIRREREIKAAREKAAEVFKTRHLEVDTAQARQEFEDSVRAAIKAADQKAVEAKLANHAEYRAAIAAATKPVELHAFHVTPQLKAAVQNEGFTLYQGGNKRGVLVGAALARAQRKAGARLDMPMSTEERMAAEGAAPSAEPPAPGDPAMAKYLAEEAAQIKQRNVKPAPPATPAVEEAAVQLDAPERALAVTDLLHDDHPKSTVRRGVKDVAKELHDRGRNALKLMGFPERLTEQNRTPESDAMLARVIAHEVSYEMKRGGKSDDWYTGSVADAMHIAAILHPEIGTNPYAAMAYKLSLAITSQGEKVTSNTRLADAAYKHYKATGRFPTDVDVKADEQINGNLAKINKLLDNGATLQDIHDFLHTKFTVRELKEDGWKGETFKVSGELLNTEVYGSAILGAKIGNGFYQNLSGNYTPTTFDLWYMRGWNRLTGNLVGQLDRDAFEKTRAKYEATLDIQKKRNMPALIKLAREDVAKHEKDFKDNRALYDLPDDDPAKKTKSLRTLAAQRFMQAVEGVNQMPTSGGQRNWMREVIGQVRENLAAVGIHVTNADIQALWWYPEKDLFAKLGGKDAGTLNTNYYQALRVLAIEQGVFKNEAEADAAVAARKRLK